VTLPTPIRIALPVPHRLTDQRTKLAFGPTPPDAELLAGLDREIQTALLDWTPGTARGRLFLAAGGAGKELLLVLDAQIAARASAHPTRVGNGPTEIHAMTPRRHDGPLTAVY
jgi:hypothetical protein